MKKAVSIMMIIAAMSVQLSSATGENCITHKSLDGSGAIFDDDPGTCTGLPTGDLVTHRLEVKSRCVRSQEILLRVVLSGDTNCLELKISVNSGSHEKCAKNERCHVTEMEKTGNVTVCSLKCPVKNTSAETYDLDLVHGLFPRSQIWCDFRVVQGDNHCSPNPCNNGACLFEDHGYTCHCYVGFNGTHWENAESAGLANRCVSVNNSGSNGALAIHYFLTREQCRQKACVCDGCSNGLTRANTFNYDSVYCILRHCETDLSVGPTGNGNPKEVWVMTGFP